MPTLQIRQRDADGSPNMTTTYCRTSSFECEELEDEIIIFERDSQAMVTLNPAGRLVWEAIEKRVTLDELEAAFLDALPDLGRKTIRQDIQGVLDALLAAGLATADDATGPG